MEIKDFVFKALNVPFVEHGRDYDGWDCWGLVVCCQRDVYGIELPSYSDEYGSTKRASELALLMDKYRRQDWIQIEQPQPGDVILMTLRGHPCHVGVMVSDRKFIHVEAGVHAVIEDIQDAPWQGRNFNHIEGIFRPIK